MGVRSTISRKLLLVLSSTGWLMAAPAPWPSAAPEASPPREVALVEKPLAAMPPTNLSPLARRALAFDPEKWKHAETPNFVLHYRRVTEAQKVAREIEYDLWFTAKTLGAAPDRYRQKSNVFVFEDDAEWAQFLSDGHMPEWMASFAFGDELFLEVRNTAGSGPRFASDILAHETTHAVVARLYPGQIWPLWLSEGFAEYMSGASVAARKGQTLKRLQHNLTEAGMSLDDLFAMTAYPTDQEKVAQLYETSERLVRFLMTELPRERLARFAEAIGGGATFDRALLAVYGDKIKDMDAFRAAYAKFSK